MIAAAAAAVATTPAERLPAPVAAVARFTPAKRARRGASVLASALDSDAGFRALAATAVRDARPDATADADATTDADGTAGPDATADDVADVALAFLTGSPLPEPALGRLREQQSLAAARRRITELEHQVQELAGRLAGERAAAAETDDPGRAALEATVATLQSRLREQGVRLRQARDEAESTRGQLRDLQSAAAGEQQQQRSEIARLTEQLSRLTRQHERLLAGAATERDARQRDRGAADRRIELLLAAMAQSVTGLRREWALQSGGELPGDLVAAELRAGQPVAPAVSRVEQLGELLALPGAHLIVDGYNVTKTGYPQLTLTDQRDRLIRTLSALAARTSAEITVVFDGAAVRTAPPAGRKTRVLFSPPGVTADDVIRRLVAAEPRGRTLLVVTSDRAIVADVTTDGATTVPSDLLLRLVNPLGD